MIEELERIRKASTAKGEETKKPKGVRITLSVCGCYSNDTLTLVIKPSQAVCDILGINKQQLECFAVTAMFTGKPQVVACYKQRDIAEEKLAQLESHTPFIARACHSFDLLEEE
jgi:hypothetical protein